MHVVVAEFVEVMHVHRQPATRYRPEHTVFSFMSKDGYVPYISIPGMPALSNGIRVVALLREANNWKTLVGWRNLATGEIAGPNVREALNRLLGISIFSVAFCAVMLSALVPELSLPGFGFFLLAIAPIYLAFSEYKAWRRAQTERALVEQLSSPNEA